VFLSSDGNTALIGAQSVSTLEGRPIFVKTGELDYKATDNDDGEVELQRDNFGF